MKRERKLERLFANCPHHGRVRVVCPLDVRARLEARDVVGVDGVNVFNVSAQLTHHATRPSIPTHDRPDASRITSRSKVRRTGWFTRLLI